MSGPNFTGNKNIELIKQALGAAESSIKLAKQLISEVESGTNSGKITNKPNGAELPGVTGVFDGESMISESGETYPVPANYASKSMLVVGDTLKLVEEGKNKEKRFKQIEHVKRHKSNGILTKKDGKWKVVTPEGSYKVLGAAVEHFGADIGTEVTLHLPANNLTVAYGAIESVKGVEKTTPEKQLETPTQQPPVVEAPKTETADKESKNPEPQIKEQKPLVKEKMEAKKETPKPIQHTPKKEPEPRKEPEPKKEVIQLPEVKVAIPETKLPDGQSGPEEKNKAIANPVEPTITTPPVQPIPKPKPVATAPAAVPMEVSPEEDELT